MLLPCWQGPGAVLAAGPCGHAVLLLLAQGVFIPFYRFNLYLK